MQENVSADLGATQDAKEGSRNGTHVKLAIAQVNEQGEIKVQIIQKINLSF